MSAKLARIIRIAIMAVLASVVAIVPVWFSGVPPKIHSWILGGGAVLFAISEMFYRSLISELNAIFRRGGYSVWQVEQLQQVIPQSRDRVWRLWNFSLWLKAIVGVIAVLLQWDGLSLPMRNIALYAGYALLFITFILSFWAQQNFRCIERMCDEIACKEIEVKEQKRLKAEMLSGKSHNFKTDKKIASYSKPPQKV